ncbi:hypothetical protein ACLB2K_068435 [Fragaria x ananassa]
MITQNFKQSRSRQKTGKKRTRRGGKVVGDAAGVFWGGGVPSPASEGGERMDVRTLSRVRTFASHPLYIYTWKTGKKRTRRGGEVVGDAAGVFWGGGVPSPALEGGERTDVRTLSRVRTSTSHPLYIYTYTHMYRG